MADFGPEAEEVQVAAPATRWRRRKQARPGEILEAALSVFAEKGYAATRMEDIAARAGVTKGTIYLYFEGKEAVFKSLVREAIGSQVSQVIENVRRYEGPAADLIRMALNMVANLITADNRVVLPKIVVTEAGNFPELARFYREEIIDKGLAMLKSVIARGIARGEFRPVDPDHTARLCVAPLILAIIWRTTFARFDAEPYDYRGLVDTHADVLLRGLKAGETP